MENKPSIAPPSPPAVAIKTRLEQVQNELAALRRRTQRATWTTVIIGILLLGVLGVYFYIGYTEIASVRKPDMLVAYGMQMIDENLPELLRTAETEVNKNAPQWAETLSKQVLDQSPYLRAELEKHSMEQ